MVKEPSKRTLNKYGLAFSDWFTIMERQKWACGMCGQPFGKYRAFVDHEHVPGYRKLSDAEKRKHVRGVLHFSCNRYLVGKNTLATAELVRQYLGRHGR